mmetsp:Transcript_19131/g.36612  ORF Transcript_19131/g.36612 Transcript_19131/m.36612 type:complete len:126 (+) Transcript_19131:92-469(+)|eukprot:CAMPEP_0114252676 /NCGR_PEP_ID=MMETSP0058-20121206/15967_1 /TAXON_ID=36894 /ORGANISM="Pyramimonas parkeae, CCMP726" /LENGTH=125 /DNA_ID=CAMNT_0001366633 /DNA_START=64 /DNA_END=441 /DNA_ORIENTATION=+
MDEQTEKDWTQLQQKLLENSGKLKSTISGMRSKESEKKRAELTEQELVELPDDTVVYKSLGRAFVFAPKPQVQDEMKQATITLQDEIDKYKNNKEYLERTQTDIESNMKELIQNSPFLKARLMGT